MNFEVVVLFVINMLTNDVFYEQYDTMEQCKTAEYEEVQHIYKTTPPVPIVVVPCGIVEVKLDDV